MNFKQYLNEDSTLDSLFEQGLYNLQDIETRWENIQVNEETKQKLNEFVSPTIIISVILGMPSIMKSITKALGFLYKKIKKLFGGKEESKVAEKIIQFTEKWHHMYVTTLRQILRMGGVFKSAGIKDKEKQIKATEVVFYTIIFGFATLGGVTTAKSIIHVVQHATTSKISMASLEGVLTSVKSKEVMDFLKDIKKI